MKNEDEELYLSCMIQFGFNLIYNVRRKQQFSSVPKNNVARKEKSCQILFLQSSGVMLLIILCSSKCTESHSGVAKQKVKQEACCSAG